VDADYSQSIKLDPNGPDPGVHEGKDLREAPFALSRVKVDARPIPLRREE